jgi:hypothetical protein
MASGDAMLETDFSTSKGVNFARWRVLPGEYLFIAEGFVLVAYGGVFRIDGYVRVNGILKV